MLAALTNEVAAEVDGDRLTVTLAAEPTDAGVTAAGTGGDAGPGTADLAPR